MNCELEPPWSGWYIYIYIYIMKMWKIYNWKIDVFSFVIESGRRLINAHGMFLKFPSLSKRICKKSLRARTRRGINMVTKIVYASGVNRSFNHNYII